MIESLFEEISKEEFVDRISILNLLATVGMTVEDKLQSLESTHKEKVKYCWDHFRNYPIDEQCPECKG